MVAYGHKFVGKITVGEGRLLRPRSPVGIRQSEEAKGERHMPDGRASLVESAIMDLGEGEQVPEAAGGDMDVRHCERERRHDRKPLLHRLEGVHGGHPRKAQLETALWSRVPMQGGLEAVENSAQ